MSHRKKNIILQNTKSFSSISYNEKKTFTQYKLYELR